MINKESNRNTSVSERINQVKDNFSDLKFVRDVYFHPESTVDGSPANFLVKPEHDVEKDVVENIAVLLKDIFEDFISAEIKVSIEHPQRKVIEHTTNNGEKHAEVVGLTSLTHRYLISIRWNSKMHGKPRDVRMDGFAVK